MTLRAYLITMILTTIVSWILWFMVLTIVDPLVTTWVGFFLFYFSLFLSLLGTAAILGFFLRFVIIKQVLAFRLVKDAFRQSFLFAVLLVVSLVLLSLDLFTWLNLLILVMGLSILEYLLLSYEKK